MIPKLIFVRGFLKTYFSHFRHCGLDLQSHANKVFNKGMLKQVQHDEEGF